MDRRRDPKIQKQLQINKIYQALTSIRKESKNQNWVKRARIGLKAVWSVVHVRLLGQRPIRRRRRQERRSRDVRGHRAEALVISTGDLANGVPPLNNEQVTDQMAS